jgi:thiol-disulfide isomerase/thioredoxin
MPRRTAAQPPRRGISGPVLIGLGVAVVLVVAIAAIALTAGSGGGASGEPGVTVTVSGTPLPALPASGDDPAVGATLPSLTGTRLGGGTITIGPSGAPQVIAVMAHWCPHCQAEVPRIVDWLRGNELPNGVALVTLSTGIDPARPNFPPSAWLTREGWTAPVLSDDASSSALSALGITSFPGFVFVNGDGTVAQRLVGELGPAQIASIAATLR